MTKLCPVCSTQLADDAVVCSACGFKLQGSTESFKPITLDDAVAPAEPQPERQQASFYVVRGPQTGTTFDFSVDQLSIGRNPQCDLFLNDMTVSRQHAHLTFTPKGWVISDDNSFNGVWINNESISTYVLKPGDIVQIGAFCLQFQCS